MSGHIDTIKRKIKNAVLTVKNALSVDKKGFVTGAILSVLLVIFMKVLPKDFGFNGSRVLYLLVLDVILLLMLGVKAEIPERLKEYMAFGSIILAPAVSFFFVEYISQNVVKDMKFQVVFMNYVCGLIFYVLLYVIFNRISIAVPVGLIIWIVYAMANRFVDVFRGYGIKAYDIYGLKTAVNVASGYELIFDKNMVKGMLIVVACATLSVMIRWKAKKKKHRVIVGISVLAV